jgi:hypothetical protein
MKHPNWPVYELVTVTAPPGVSLTPSSLRVPRQYFGYRADDYLRPFAAPDRPNLLRFGHWGTFMILCLDVTSGEVIDLVVSDGRPLKRASPGMDFVNSSLEQFNRSIEVLIDLFPYGGDTPNDPDFDWDPVAKKLLKALEAIDERVSSEWQGLWAEFYWDVTMGIYATCDLLDN